MVASGLAEDLELFYQLCGNVANDGTRPSLEADESRRLRRAYESLSTDLNPHPIPEIRRYVNVSKHHCEGRWRASCPQFL